MFLVDIVRYFCGFQSGYVLLQNRDVNLRMLGIEVRSPRRVLRLQLTEMETWATWFRGLMYICKKAYDKWHRNIALDDHLVRHLSTLAGLGHLTSVTFKDMILLLKQLKIPHGTAISNIVLLQRFYADVSYIEEIFDAWNPDGDDLLETEEFAPLLESTLEHPYLNDFYDAYYDDSQNRLMSLTSFEAFLQDVQQAANREVEIATAFVQNLQPPFVTNEKQLTRMGFLYLLSLSPINAPGRLYQPFFNSWVNPLKAVEYQRNDLPLSSYWIMGVCDICLPVTGIDCYMFVLS